MKHTSMDKNKTTKNMKMKKFKSKSTNKMERKKK